MQLATVLVAIFLGVAQARPQQFLDASGFGASGVIAGSSGQSAVSRGFPTTPAPVVPIIRHINRVNNDGSYTFGYESGDGSFRVETKAIDGTIRGKYGYVDEHGQRKEVDYLAGSVTGYEPSGQGITVPPRPPPRPPGQEFLDYDDGTGTTSRPRQQRVRFQQQAQPQQVFVQAPRPAAQPVRQVAAIQAPPQFIQAAAPAPQQFQAIQQQPAVSQSLHAAQFAPAPAPQRAPVAVVARPQASAAGGPSPIEQFLRQQLSGAPAQPF